MSSESVKALADQIEKQNLSLKNRVNELSGENLKLDYAVAALRQDVSQKKKSFQLLSKLQKVLGQQPEANAVFRITLQAIIEDLLMDKGIVFLPGKDENQFHPTIMMGFPQGEDEKLKNEALLIPPFAGETLLVNRSTTLHPQHPLKGFHDCIQMQFELPHFIALSVLVGEEVIGIMVVGRTREAPPLFPPLDQNNLDALLGIAGLISATIENFKIHALKELDRLKSEFFANISHEFRTPIALTIGPLESVLANRFGEVNAQTREYLEIGLQNQRTLLKLINQVLDLAKSESGNQNLQLREIKDFPSFLHQILKQFAGLADKKGIHLQLECHPQLSKTKIILDEDKIEQIVRNLLSNAMKFTEKGFVKLSAKLETSNLIIEIADSGQGMKEDQLKVIFDRYKQAEGSTSKDMAGTGIGLALVNEFVQLHQGKISVKSQFGEGSQFFVILPLTAGEPQDIQSPSNAQIPPEVELAAPSVRSFNEKAAKNHSKKIPTVLFVDDHPQIRNYVSGLLSGKYNVYLAEDGEQGLEMADLLFPDLILSDYMMPKMDGSEFLKKIKADRRLSEIPFILLTARTESETRITQLQNGVDDYLSKPFSEAELLARVNNLILIRQQKRLMQKDLMAARDIQRALLPPDVQDWGEAKCEVLYHPSSELSGDFFDRFDKGEWTYFYLADVTSHGTASAQVTYMVKGIFKHILESKSTPIRVSDLMKEFGKQYVKLGLDYAVAIQIIRWNSRLKKIELCRSAFPPAFIIRHKKIMAINVECAPIILTGFYDDSKDFPEESVSLMSGDEFYMMTDGCFEFPLASGIQRFDEKKFYNLLNQLPRRDWRKELFKGLQVERGQNEFPDDLTIMRIKVK